MLLAQRQHALLGEVISQATHLPFIGGALGLFGYDLGRRFERLPSLAARDVTIPEMAVGIYDWALLRTWQRASGSWCTGAMRPALSAACSGLRRSRQPPLSPLPCRENGRAT